MMRVRADGPASPSTAQADEGRPPDTRERRHDSREREGDRRDGHHGQRLQGERLRLRDAFDAKPTQVHSRSGPRSLRRSTGCSRRAEDAGGEALLEARDRLAPLLAQGNQGGQPLHGDASLSNLLATRAGLRWTDFEDACLAQQHGDVVELFDDARVRFGEAFAADLLAAYGRDVDPTLVQLVRDAHDLYRTLWRQYRTTIPAAQP
jgi:hypothetical protein